MWKADSFDTINKEIHLKSSNTDCELLITIDYDDVNHKRVKKQINKLIQILNDAEESDIMGYSIWK